VAGNDTDTSVYVAGHPRWTRLPGVQMVVRVTADLVALLRETVHERWLILSASSQDEEGRRHPVVAKKVE
jgi:hypothetical protein